MKLWKNKKDGGKVKIFGKLYSLKDLQMIGQEKVEDDLLEWINQDLDYICDCSMVRFFEIYRWRFQNKQNLQFVDIYVKYYPDTNTISFNGDKKKEFIYYQNYSKERGIEKNNCSKR